MPQGLRWLKRSASQRIDRLTAAVHVGNVAVPVMVLPRGKGIHHSDAGHTRIQLWRTCGIRYSSPLLERAGVPFAPLGSPGSFNPPTSSTKTFTSRPLPRHDHHTKTRPGKSGQVTEHRRRGRLPSFEQDAANFQLVSSRHEHASLNSRLTSRACRPCRRQRRWGLIRKRGVSRGGHDQRIRDVRQRPVHHLAER